MPAELKPRHFEISGHPAWKEAFSDERRDEQIDEDLRASKTVCGLLIAIVTMGLLLGIVSVWISV